MDSILVDINTSEIGRVKDRYAWVLIFLPVIYSLINYLIPNIQHGYVAMIIVCMVINVTFLKRDKYELRAAGYDNSPWIIMALIIPLYFLLRPKPLVINRYCSFVLSLLLCFLPAQIVTSLLYSDSLDSTACDTTTSILHEQLHVDSVCKSIIDRTEVSDKIYTAKAVLDNGESIPITIKKINDGFIYVIINNDK